MCACDQHAISTHKLSDDLGENRVDVLDAMRFINDDVLPGELFEGPLLD